MNVRTEVEDDGVHGVWFNRGIAGSQAFRRAFPRLGAAEPAGRGRPGHGLALGGLGEGAPLAFVGEALDGDWGLRGAFYEFTWGRALEAFAAARDRGVDVQLVVHGRDRDSATSTEDNDRTADLARERVQRHGIPDLVTWRRRRTSLRCSTTSSSS